MITGATGFIGSHLTEALLQDGWKVIAAVRRQSRLEWLKRQPVEIREVDPHQERSWSSAICDVDVVFHLAGAVAGPLSRLMKANGEMSRALSLACSKVETPPVLILVSSLSAAGPSARNQPRSPTLPPTPVSCYGRSKLSGEMAVLEVADRVPTTILRPGIVFGPRDTELVQILRPIHYLRINPLAGFHDPQVSFVHVADLVEAIKLAYHRGKRCAQMPTEGIYFVADPEPMSFLELGMLAAREMDLRVIPIRIPISLLRMVAGANALIARLFGKYPTLNADKIREAAQPAWIGDVRPTMEDLQWSPSAPLRDRLTEFVRSFVDGH